MHLILALSVIVLQHVDSYSCRSISRKLDDLQSKSAEDSSESYELKNDKIIELLQPFIKPEQQEALKSQQLQKNLAKLTIEPYLEKNQTHKWRRNSFGRFNKRKTIAPLAIILTQLPDLKLKQGQNSMQKKKYIMDKYNNLQFSSRVTTDKKQYDLIKHNKDEEIPKEVIHLNTHEDKNSVSDINRGNNQEPFENNLNNRETPKPEINAISPEVITESQDVVSSKGKDSNDLANIERLEEYTDGQKSQTKLIPNQFMSKGSLIQGTKLLEVVKSNKDKSPLDDYTLDSTDLKYQDKSDNTDDKNQDDIIVISSEERDTFSQNKEQSQQFDQQHRDIEVTDNLNTKDSSENDFDRLDAKASAENEKMISEIKNTEPMIPRAEEPLSKEHLTENYKINFRIPVNNLQTFHLGTDEDEDDDEETRKEKDEKTILFTHQNRLQSSEDKIVLESEGKLSKEQDTENSLESPHKHLYKPGEDTFQEDKELSEDDSEQNAHISSQEDVLNLQQDIIPETDKEISNGYRQEDSLNFHKKHLYSSEVTHKGHKCWHHDIHDGHHYHPHNVYNLCFHFKR